MTPDSEIPRNASPMIVVRHGESEWNVLGKWQGRADTLLTDAGRSQARRAATSLLSSGIALDYIVASTLSRARETAEIIASTLNMPAPIVDERLIETDVGPWEGLREHEIEAGWPNHLRDRRTPPEFEPPHVVFERASAALVEYSRAGQRVLIVSHSGVIRTVRRLMNVHDRRLRNLEGCYFHVDDRGSLVAGNFIALSGDSRSTTNDSV